MINRRSDIYAKLPDEMFGKRVKEAKLSVSLNLVLPKELEGKANKFLDNVNDEVSDMFRKFIKKQVKKYNEEEY